jgi:hypothetical protein
MNNFYNKTVYEGKVPTPSLTINGFRGPFSYEPEFNYVVTGCCPCIIYGYNHQSIPPYELVKYRYAQTHSEPIAKTITMLLNNLWESIK